MLTKKEINDLYGSGFEEFSGNDKVIFLTLEHYLNRRFTFYNTENLIKAIEGYDYIAAAEMCRDDSGRYILKKLFNLIPDDQKYKFFNNCYCMDGYKISKYITTKISEKVNSLIPSQDHDHLQQLTDENGYLTIYRTDHKGSSSLKQALSWSLDENQAELFTIRYSVHTGDKNYQIHTAKVKINDIISYCNDRNEQEIVVRFSNLEQLTTTKRAMTNEKIEQCG